jgi:serine/threonine-protein kinase
VVAARVTAYLAGVQERLRQAELDRAAAQAKAAAERRARRLTVGLAVAGLALLLLAGGGGLWLVQRRAATAAAVEAALDKAWQFQTEGKRAEAEAAARQAAALLEDTWGHADLRRRVDDVRADIDMAGILEEIRLQRAELTGAGRSHTPREIDQAYAKAFQDYGLPVQELTTDEAAERMRQRAIAVPLALALDEWALQRKALPKRESGGWRHLLEAARRADPDEWRGRFRAALLEDVPKELPALVVQAKKKALPAPSWLLLAQAVQGAGGGAPRSVALLQLSEHQHPDDFWTHFRLADLCLTELKPPQLDKAIRHYSVARALRPSNPVVLCNLGKALLDKGLPEAAIPIFRDAVRLRHNFPEAQCNLGAALTRMSAWDEVLAFSQEATRLKPDLVEAHFNCGLALLRVRPPRLPEALAAFDRTVALRPGYALGHSGRGQVFLAKGETAQALTAFDRALELQADLDDAHHGRFNALFQLGKYAEALAAADQAVKLLPNNAAAHGNRSRALARLGKFEDALAAVDRAIALIPAPGEDLAIAHHLRGQILKNLGRYAEAVDACREATRINADNAEAHCDLGLLVQELGQFGEALPILRRGRELGLKKPGWPYANESAEWVSDCERLLGLGRRLPAVLQGRDKPADADEAVQFARCCWYMRRYGAAAQCFEKAFTDQPRLAEDLTRQWRFSAARVAALAGCSQEGKDDPPLDDSARAQWRRQAVGWLRADLAARARQADDDKAEVRAELAKTLELWKDVHEFAGLRDAPELAKRSEEERRACRELWAEVDALLSRIRTRETAAPP